MSPKTHATRAWASILAIIVLSSIFVGAGGRATGPSVSAQAQGQTFSTLRVGELQQPDSLNPFVGVLTASYIVWAHTYDLLVGIGPDLTPVPSLAQSWSVDSAGLNWTFNLVHNATFHDGVPFTAEDVNFTFRYIWPQTDWNPIGCDLTLLQSYLGDPTTNTGVDVNNITVLDPYTIRIPTYQPKANMLSMFIQILPKHIWSSISCEQAVHVSNDPPIGTGMYKVTTWVRGTYIQLDLNRNYFRLDKNQDYVDRILIYYYSDASALYNAFVAGVIDATDALPSDKFMLVPATVGGASSSNVGKLTVDAIQLVEMGGCMASDELIAMNDATGGRNWLVTNLTVRQALQYSVDRSSIVQNVISGLGTPGSTFIPPATPFWHYNVTAAENYSFNLDKARALLNDPAGDGYTLKAGATAPGDYGQNLDPTAANNQDAFADTNGDNIREVVNASNVVAGDQWGSSAPNSNQLKFTLSIRNYDAEGLNAADRMESWWSQIGISVTTEVVTESSLIDATYACTEDFYIWGWGGDVDPDFLLSVMTTDQILNWQDAWYSNATYDADYVLQQSQVNPYERQQTIWEMQKILYHDAPYLILYYPYLVTVVRTDTFTGWGDWRSHPGLGLTGYGNDLVMLTLRATGGVANECPTPPILEGTSPIQTFANVTVGFSANASDLENDPLAWVFYWGDGNATIVNTTAGATSAWAEFTWERAGTYNVTVEVSDNLCGAAQTSVPLEVLVDDLPTTFGWVTGSVTDGTASGHPAILGATVTATAGGGGIFATTTGANGQYSLTLPISSSFTVGASQALYASKSSTGVAVTDQGTTTVDLALSWNRGWIAGTITSSAGGAIPDVGLLLTGARGASVRTDGGGHYNVTLAPGTYQVTTSHPDFVSQNRTGVTVGAGQTVSLDFVLEPTTPPGLSPWILGLIAAVIIIAAVGLIAWWMIRRRKKEALEETPLPPPRQPGAP